MTKTSMNIPDPEFSALHKMANQNAMTVTDVVRRAIRVLKTLDDAQNSGDEILIRHADTKQLDRLVIL